MYVADSIPSLDADLSVIKEKIPELLEIAFSNFSVARSQRPFQYSTARLTASDYPQNSAPLGQTLDELSGLLLKNLQCAALNPGFMAWANGASNSLVFYGELLNCAAHLTAQSPSQLSIQIEEELTNWVQQMLGWPSEAKGLMLSGSSAGNLHALMLARNWMFPEIKKQGWGQSPQLTVYGSEHTHMTIKRALNVLGLGDGSFKPVPVTNTGSIDTGALRKMMSTDAGKKILIGNAGTTLCGAFDDFSELASCAAEYQAWFHIDAAWGGWLSSSTDYASLMKANELADSITIDFHKWPGSQIGAALVLHKNKVTGEEVFGVECDYLHPVSEYDENYGQKGIELTRSSRAITPWLILKHCGINTIGRRLDYNCSLAAYLSDGLKDIPLCHQPYQVSSITVLLQILHPQVSTQKMNEKIENFVKDLWMEGVVFPSISLVGDAKCVRFCLLNHSIKKENIDAILKRIRIFTEGLNNVHTKRLD